MADDVMKAPTMPIGGRPEPTRRGNWQAILGIVLLALFSGASSLYTVERLKNAVVAMALHGQAISPSRLLAVLGPWDAALAGLSAAALAVLIYLESRRRSLSGLLGSMTPAQSFVLLTVIVAWLGQAYLYPGVLLGGDTGSHIARFLEVRDGLAAGTLPQWTNFDYLGSPLLGFTGPLLYVVGGALDLLVRDPFATAKILLFASHLGAGLLFYALLLRFGIGRSAAMLAAIGYAGSFSMLHLFLFRGVYPQAFTILFLVLAFYAAEGIMRRAGPLWRDWLIFALSVGGMIVNHQPHALFTGLYLGLFGAVSLAVGRWGWSRLWALASAGMVGAGISTVAVLPIIVEAHWVMIDPEGGLFRFHLPTLERLGHLVIWRDTRTTYGIDYWAYLGIVLVGLAIVGGWVALRGRLGPERRRLAWAVAPGLGACFVLYNPVVRDVMYIVFFVGILAALGLEWLAVAVRPGSHLLLITATVLLIDVASTSVQPVARSDKQFLIDAGLYLARIAPDERIAEIDLGSDGSPAVNVGPGSGPLSAYATVQRIAGHHNMAATHVHNYAVTILEMMERDLRRDRRVAEPTLSLLRLLNVTRIICFTATAVGCPDSYAQAAAEGPLGRVVHVADGSPVVFSRHLVALAPPPGFDKPMLWAEDYENVPANPVVQRIEDYLGRYLQEAGIVWSSRMAAALPVRSVAPVGQSNDSDDAAWHAALSRYAVSLQGETMRIEASGPGYAQLTHPWYPASVVRINGRTVTPFEGAFDLLVVPLETGVNDIDVEPMTTPLRLYSAAASAAMLLFAGLVAAFLALAEKRTGRRDRVDVRPTRSV